VTGNPIMACGELVVQELLRSVAARTPAPGGGAVAAVTAALATALGQMVAHYAAGKPPAGAETRFGEALRGLGRLQSVALELADADAAAFTKLSELWKLSPDHERRQREWTDAVEAAIDVPKRVMETSLQTLVLLRSLDGSTNRHMVGDLAISALLAEAAGRAAAWIVRINLRLLTDDARSQELEAATRSTLAEALNIYRAIEESCRV